MSKFKPFNIKQFQEYSSKYDLNFNKNRTLNCVLGKNDFKYNYLYFDVKKELEHRCDVCNKKETITKVLVKIDKNKSFISVEGIIRECANCEFIYNLKRDGGKE